MPASRETTAKIADAIRTSVSDPAERRALAAEIALALREEDDQFDAAEFRGRAAGPEGARVRSGRGAQYGDGCTQINRF